jgi:hypothetical protein
MPRSADIDTLIETELNSPRVRRTAKAHSTAVMTASTNPAFVAASLVEGASLRPIPMHQRPRSLVRAHSPQRGRREPLMPPFFFGKTVDFSAVRILHGDRTSAFFGNLGELLGNL